MARSAWRAALPRLLEAVHKSNSRGASPQPASDSLFDFHTGFKIIEKDDPESCNHMTHKNTDVMPCTRERTDFCSCLCKNRFAATPARWRGSVGAPDSVVDFHTGYCCGVEISPDYPHAELDKPDIPHFPDGVFQDCRAVQLGYATMVQKRRLTGRSGRRRRDVAPLETEATAGLFGAYFGNAESPIQGEGFADETPAERRRRRRRQRREAGDDGRPRRPRSATGSGSGSGSGRRRRHFESP